MKVLHFVLIAQHLTGDSSVHFFPTRAKAQRFFDNKVKPLLEICERNELEEDEAYSFGQTKDYVRFDSGYDEELDEILGQCNHYYRVDSVEVADDVDCYIAEFSEWVDESVITFYPKAEAITTYNDMVDEGIEASSRYARCDINRYDQSTWESEGEGTMFQESDNEDGSTDAFFGWDIDCYWTTRIGKIEMGV